MSLSQICFWPIPSPVASILMYCLFFVIIWTRIDRFRHPSEHHFITVTFFFWITRLRCHVPSVTWTIECHTCTVSKNEHTSFRPFPSLSGCGFSHNHNFFELFHLSCKLYSPVLFTDTRVTYNRGYVHRIVYAPDRIHNTTYSLPQRKSLSYTYTKTTHPQQHTPTLSLTHTMTDSERDVRQLHVSSTRGRLTRQE